MPQHHSQQALVEEAALTDFTALHSLLGPIDRQKKTIQTFIETLPKNSATRTAIDKAFQCVAGSTSSNASISEFDFTTFAFQSELCTLVEAGLHCRSIPIHGVVNRNLFLVVDREEAANQQQQQQHEGRLPNEGRTKREEEEQNHNNDVSEGNVSMRTARRSDATTASAQQQPFRQHKERRSEVKALFPSHCKQIFDFVTHNTSQMNRIGFWLALVHAAFHVLDEADESSLLDKIQRELADAKGAAAAGGPSSSSASRDGTHQQQQQEAQQHQHDVAVHVNIQLEGIVSTLCILYVNFYVKNHTVTYPFPKQHFQNNLNTQRVLWRYSEALEDVYNMFTPEDLDGMQYEHFERFASEFGNLQQLTAQGCQRIFSACVSYRVADGSCLTFDAFFEAIVRIACELLSEEPFSRWVTLEAKTAHYMSSVFSSAYKSIFARDIPMEGERSPLPVITAVAPTSISLNELLESQQRPSGALTAPGDGVDSTFSPLASVTIDLTVQGEYIGALGRGCWVYCSIGDAVRHCEMDSIHEDGSGFTLRIPLSDLTTSNRNPNTHHHQSSSVTPFAPSGILSDDESESSGGNDVSSVSSSQLLYWDRCEVTNPIRTPTSGFSCTPVYTSVAKLAVGNAPEEVPFWCPLHNVAKLDLTLSEVQLPAKLVSELEAVFKKGCAKSSSFNTNFLYENCWRWVCDCYSIAIGNCNVFSLMRVQQHHLQGQQHKQQQSVPERAALMRRVAHSRDELLLSLFRSVATVSPKDVAARPLIQFDVFLELIVRIALTHGAPVAHTATIVKNFLFPNASARVGGVAASIPAIRRETLVESSGADATAAAADEAKGGAKAQPTKGKKEKAAASEQSEAEGVVSSPPESPTATATPAASAKQQQQLQSLQRQLETAHHKHDHLMKRADADRRALDVTKQSLATTRERLAEKEKSEAEFLENKKTVVTSLMETRGLVELLVGEHGSSKKPSSSSSTAPVVDPSSNPAIAKVYKDSVLQSFRSNIGLLTSSTSSSSATSATTAAATANAGSNFFDLDRFKANVSEAVAEAELKALAMPGGSGSPARGGGGGSGGGVGEQGGANAGAAAASSRAASRLMDLVEQLARTEKREKALYKQLADTTTELQQLKRSSASEISELRTNLESQTEARQKMEDTALALRQAARENEKTTAKMKLQIDKQTKHQRHLEQMLESQKLHVQHSNTKVAAATAARAAAEQQRERSGANNDTNSKAGGDLAATAGGGVDVGDDADLAAATTRAGAHSKSYSGFSPSHPKHHHNQQQKQQQQQDHQHASPSEPSSREIVLNHQIKTLTERSHALEQLAAKCVAQADASAVQLEKTETLLEAETRQRQDLEKVLDAVDRWAKVGGDPQSLRKVIAAFRGEEFQQDEQRAEAPQIRDASTSETEDHAVEKEDENEDSAPLVTSASSSDATATTSASKRNKIKRGVRKGNPNAATAASSPTSPKKKREEKGKDAVKSPKNEEQEAEESTSAFPVDDAENDEKTKMQKTSQQQQEEESQEASTREVVARHFVKEDEKETQEEAKVCSACLEWQKEIEQLDDAIDSVHATASGIRRDFSALKRFVQQRLQNYSALFLQMQRQVLIKKALITANTTTAVSSAPFPSSSSAATAAAPVVSAETIAHKRQSLGPLVAAANNNTQQEEKQARSGSGGEGLLPSLRFQQHPEQKKRPSAEIALPQQWATGGKVTQGEEEEDGEEAAPNIAMYSYDTTERRRVAVTIVNAQGEAEEVEVFSDDYGEEEEEGGDGSRRHGKKDGDATTGGAKSAAAASTTLFAEYDATERQQKEQKQPQSSFLTIQQYPDQQPQQKQQQHSPADVDTAFHQHHTLTRNEEAQKQRQERAGFVAFGEKMSLPQPATSTASRSAKEKDTKTVQEDEAKKSEAGAGPDAALPSLEGGITGVRALPTRKQQQQDESNDNNNTTEIKQQQEEQIVMRPHSPTIPTAGSPNGLEKQGQLKRGVVEHREMHLDWDSTAEQEAEATTAMTTAESAARRRRSSTSGGGATARTTAAAAGYAQWVGTRVEVSEEGVGNTRHNYATSSPLSSPQQQVPPPQREQEGNYHSNVPSSAPLAHQPSSSSSRRSNSIAVAEQQPGSAATSNAYRRSSNSSNVVVAGQTTTVTDTANNTNSIYDEQLTSLLLLNKGKGTGGRQLMAHQPGVPESLQIRDPRPPPAVGPNTNLPMPSRLWTTTSRGTTTTATNASNIGGVKRAATARAQTQQTQVAPVYKVQPPAMLLQGKKTSSKGGKM